MDLPTARRLALGVAVGLAVLGGSSPADAQEWAIYLQARSEPVRASFYTEEPPWVFFRDDDSQYVFAVGCDRVERVERDGREIAHPLCPVERLPTMMPRVYQAIMDLEDKRLKDARARFGSEIRACNQAIGTPAVATGGGPARQVEETALCQSPEAIAFLEDQVRDAQNEIHRSNARIWALLRVLNTYRVERPGPVQRFFFFTR